MHWPCTQRHWWSLCRLLNTSVKYLGSKRKVNKKRPSLPRFPLFICLNQPAVGGHCHGFNRTQALHGHLDCRHRFEILSVCNNCYWDEIDLHSIRESELDLTFGHICPLSMVSCLATYTQWTRKPSPLLFSPLDPTVNGSCKYCCIGSLSKIFHPNMMLIYYSWHKSSPF